MNLPGLLLPKNVAQRPGKFLTRNGVCKQQFTKLTLAKLKNINYIITIKQETNNQRGITMKKTITTKQFHKTLKNRGASKEEIKQMDDLVNEVANLLGNFKIAARFKL